MHSLFCWFRAAPCRRVPLLPLFLALLLWSAAHAASALTLDEAQRRAVERSRQISAQDSGVLAAREMAVAAGALPDPVLKLGIDNLPVDGADRFNLTRDFMTQRRIGLMQEFTRDDKRLARSARYEREAERAQAEKAVTVASIHKETALAWLDRYYSEAMQAATAGQVAQARLEIEAADAAYRAGRGSRADVLAARSLLAGLEDKLSDVERRVRAAKIMLARWVGEDAVAPLAGEPRIDAVALDINGLEGQLAQHPQIAVLGKQEQLAEAEAQLARANRQADWGVELSYSQRGPQYSNMVAVGISIPLQWDRKNRQDRELASKLALIDQSKALREDALRAHVAEVRALLEEWENGRRRISRYESELVPLADERTQAVLAAYRGGKASLADVLAARRGETEIRIQTLQLRADTARLWAQLNFLGAEEPTAPGRDKP
jgi:outer membrane protein TolC